MTTVNAQPAVLAAPPPVARGPLSEAVLTTLRGRADDGLAPRLAGLPVQDADPYGDDLQLALYCCYELHYQGFPGVDEDWEWSPELLRLRGALERRFEQALRDELPACTDVAAALEPLLAEPVDGGGVSHFLRDEGDWRHLREHIALRSVYHLKEADPHAFVIPRLTGQAKASLVAVEFDEYGGGRGDRVHARLFADLMRAIGLDAAYNGFLDAAPASMLATVNLMSLCGLRRRLRGAMVGHFAAAEIGTPPSARRIVAALERLGADPAATLFFTEHIEADAVHEQVMRREVIGDLLAREQALAADVVFGIEATSLLDERYGAEVLAAWRQGRSALRTPLPD